MIDPRILDPGETLVWTGRPVALSYALRKGASTFFPGIFFFGFSVFWVWGASHANNNAGPFWLFGIPFVLIGALMLLSPFWHFWRGLNATYVLTNKRALISISGPFAQRLSFPLHQIPFVDVRPTKDDAGSIYFNETTKKSGDGYRTTREGFVAVQELTRVEQLLRQAINGGARRPA
jgi:hypothetical protein